MSCNKIICVYKKNIFEDSIIKKNTTLKSILQVYHGDVIFNDIDMLPVFFPDQVSDRLI